MPVDIVKVAVNNILRMSFRLIISLAPETTIPACTESGRFSNGFDWKTAEPLIQYKSDSMAAKFRREEQLQHVKT